MPRKLRIQYSGALYHVLNRGNYGRKVFQTDDAARSFVEALEEATSRYGWRIHAYVIMRDHYHLAIETPQPNLVDGMHWLQSTVATRLNRFREERGHLFEGRYQAILLEDFSTLARVVSYIHLNPVRSGMVTAKELVRFPWSSFVRFKIRDFFPGLSAADWLSTLELADTPSGWQAYAKYLIGLAEDPKEQKHQGFKTLSRGWAIGAKGWKAAVAREYAQFALSPGLESQQLRDLKETRWKEHLQKLMTEAKRSNADALTSAKSAPWKLLIASKMRNDHGAAVGWIANELHMGKPSAVRSHLSRLKRESNATDASDSGARLDKSDFESD